MQRIALGIEYVGTGYSGWQRQNAPAVPSVQIELEKALTKVANQAVTTVCAGRTDSGVHASAQVVHFDVETIRTERAWVCGANANLPRDIRVLWAKLVPQEFDARRSAVQRHYRYVVYNNLIRPSLLRDCVTWQYISLDAILMQQAAQSWIGTHDYSSFRAAGCQSRSPIRAVSTIAVQRSGDLIIFDILANAFLYHMVRNMVGTLFEIGSGKRPVAWAHEVLLAKDRSKASITAPPNGLYLVGVKYPAWMQIPELSPGLWFFNQGFIK